MTRTGRNNTIIVLLTGLLLANILVLTVFLERLAVVPPGGSIVPDRDEWEAIAGAVTSTVLSFTAAFVYVRLFRRSPSVPIFFIVLFFLFSTIDISKLGQVMIPATAWRHFSPILSRVTVFGHISAALALFAAGLYASVTRMQRHGTVMMIGVLIALGLSWAVPIDTLYMPSNLVYTAGFRPTLDAMVRVVFALAIVNFSQAAVTSRDRRRAFSAVAIALLVIGREILFYRPEPVLLIAGAVAFFTGTILYAVQNYRDYLVS